jgi:DNA-binding transcriptional LysR family regulator
VLPADAPDLTALDLFDSLAELGSLGRVARRHQVTQPAVSMRMSGLERRLGLTLLRRDPSGTHLTAAGERVAVAARRVLAAAHELMSTVDGLHAEENLLLRVAASLTVADYLLPAWIGTVHRDLPEISLTLEVTNSSRVISAVGKGRVDIGFVEGHQRDLPGMTSVVLRSDRLEVVVAPQHSWARRRRPVTARELAAAELITREKGSGPREVLEDALAPWGGIRSHLELGSSSAIVAAARRGEGPAVLSALAVADDLTDGRLVAVPTDGVDLTRAFRAVWLTDRPLPALAQRLLAAATPEGHPPSDATPEPRQPCAEEALGHGVIEAIPDAAHGAEQPGGSEA